MIHRLTALALLLLSSALPARACDCLWQGPFTEVQQRASVVLRGEVVASKGNSLDLQVAEVLAGKEFAETVRVWGDTGELCRAKVEDFPLGSQWLMALQRIDSVPEGGFNPNTPNISFGRPGDYSLSRCGVYWLQVTGEVVTDNIADAKRWQYQDDKKTPVLLSLLRGFLAGKLPVAALREASKPQAQSKQLMDQTQMFLWQQRYEE